MKTPNKETTEHTPGPWVAERMFNPPKAKDRRCGFVVNAPENGEPLPARISDLRVPPGMGSFSEYQANARLIAAAPDLLAALERMTANLEESHQDEINDNHGGDGPDGCSYCRDIAAARAAIAKAKGHK